MNKSKIPHQFKQHVVKGCINQRIKAFYVVNHKVANTSINNCLVSMNSGFTERTSSAKPDDWSDYFKFTFVRNPYDRLVSRYRHMYYSLLPEECQPPGLDMCGWVKWNMAQFCVDMKVNYDPKHFTFSNFVKFIINRDDPHWLPQTEVILNACGCNSNKTNLTNIHDELSYIGKFENLESDFKKLSNMLGLPDIDLIHCNSTTQNNVNTPEALQREYMDFYDDESYHLVTNYYTDDLLNFEYQFNNTDRDICLV